MPPDYQKLYGQARDIHEALKQDDRFTHAGPESRGVVVPPLSDQFSELASLVEDPAVKAVIIQATALVAAASADLNTSYIRTKAGPKGVHIALRGDTGPVDYDKLKIDDIVAVTRRGSGVQVFIGENVVGLDADSAFLQTAAGIRVDEPINELIQSLSEDQRARIAAGLLNIAEEEVTKAVARLRE